MLRIALGRSESTSYYEWAVGEDLTATIASRERGASADAPPFRGRRFASTIAAAPPIAKIRVMSTYGYSYYYYYMYRAGFGR